MGNKEFLKLFFVIMFSTTFLIGFSHYGASALERVIYAENRFTEGTKVGGIDISDLTKQEAEQLVESKAAEWLTAPPVSLIGSEIVMQAPGDLFRLDVQQSIGQAVDGKKVELIANVDEEQLLVFVKEHLPESWAKGIEIGKLSKDLANVASSLQTLPALFNVVDYMNEEAKPLFTDQVISKVTREKLGVEHHVLLLWLSQHPVAEIKGNSQFSVQKFLEGAKDLSPQSASILASAIYELVLSTNFEIVERHISRELPLGTTPGLEARLDFQRYNFLLYNPNFNDYKLEFQVANGGFTIILKGVPFVQKYIYEHGETEFFDPKTIVHYSNDVQAGEKQIKQEGKRGLLAKVIRKVFDINGNLLETKVMSEDFYLPVHKIEVHPLLSGNSKEAEGRNQEDSLPPQNTKEDEENKNENGEDTQREDSKGTANEQTDVYEK